jgi:putative tryptophan/tyrosine transport system substrate-binding protein
MRRREFISLIGGAAASPLAARAQQPKMPVIGLLSPESSTSTDVDGLRAGLRELGYTEGRNIRIEYRWSNGNFEQLPALAEELVGLNADVIVTFVTQASIAAKKATATIPIVMVGVAEPIGSGLIASLAHPGGNVTGTSSVATDVVSKQFGMLKQLSPGVTRIAALWNPADPVFQAQQLRQTEAAAQELGIELQLLEARRPNDFDAAFAAIEGTRTLFILIDPLFITHFRALAELSVKRRLIAIFGYRTFADAGGLMAYGPNYSDLYKRTAAYVDKILKGAKPADLPVEQPTKFEFVINLKTANALDITVPPVLVATADKVIE